MTWTQVGQYIILVIAYLAPVVWLSVKDTGSPIAQLSAGSVLRQISAKELQLRDDPAEQAVRRLWRGQAWEMARRLDALPQSWAQEKERLRARLAERVAADAPMVEVRTLERELADFPPDPQAARVAWSKARQAYEARGSPSVPYAQPFAAGSATENRNLRVNFLALVLCLMLGTAGMPHILTRSYTTASVGEARKSVLWALLFILLVYFTAPALALLVKYEVYTQLVGSSYASLPAWVHAWGAVDPNLVSMSDINRDGIVQSGEIGIGADAVVLAMPEIGGLPYMMSGLVAAGALAAALSTADGLLLTLSNSLSHDTWYRVVAPRTRADRRVIVSKVLLLLVAFAAAWVAARKPADILIMVSAAFSFAASSFFPALVMGVFWKRANKWGATLGMAVGLAVTFAYMAHAEPSLREWVFNVPRTQPVHLWWGIQSICAGLFGAPAAFLTIVVVSLLTPRPDAATEALVDYLREPAQ